MSELNTGTPHETTDWSCFWMPDDMTIIESIRAALADDDRVGHTGGVALSCREGWVTLRGTVASPRQRRVAHELARAQRGVRGVEVELKLDLRDRRPDDELRGSALRALIGDAGVPAERVDMPSADGWLTLTGAVKEQWAPAAFTQSG